MRMICLDVSTRSNARPGHWPKTRREIGSPERKTLSCRACGLFAAAMPVAEQVRKWTVQSYWRA